jgi:hypothetical protein
MGPMKDGRGVLWSCLLRISISEDAYDASRLLQSRSMDITERKTGSYHIWDAPTNDTPVTDSKKSANDLYRSNKEDLLRSTSMSTPTPFSKNTMLHQRIENTRDLSRGSYEMTGV